jgi:hypothetical protein
MDLALSDPQVRISSYLASIDALIAQGASVTDTFTKTRAGWKAANSDPTTADLEAKILEAIGTGDAGKVEAAMLAAQLAKADRSQIRGRIARGVLPALRAAYAGTSADNYAAIAKAFDEAAGRLATCASKVDAELDAGKVVALSDEQRTAWMDAGVIAKEVDRLLAVLLEAAALAGIPDTDSNLGTRIALATDPGSAHRRRVHESWASKGRCGRWPALLALGVKLRAATLEGFEPYADPAPITIRQVSVAMGAGVHGVRQVPVDPEDAAYKAANA